MNYIKMKFCTKVQLEIERGAGRNNPTDGVKGASMAG